MRPIWGAFRTIAVTMLVLTPMPAASAQPGNSGAAHQCQQGGWQSLVRAEDGGGFANQGDCVSYAAQGGTLEERITRTLAVTWSYALFVDEGHVGLCHANFFVTGFEPGDYGAYLDPDGGFSGSPYTIVVDENGNGSGTSHSGHSVDDAFLNGTEITVTVDGLSVTSTVSCSIPIW